MWQSSSFFSHLTRVAGTTAHLDSLLMSIVFASDVRCAFSVVVADYLIRHDKGYKLCCSFPQRESQPVLEIVIILH